MNREIKFRGFSEEVKTFIYGFYHEVEAAGVGYSYIFWQGIETPVRADSVSQFTGLYDRNDKAIYEGDVCNLVATEEYKSNLHMIGVRQVVWDNEDARFYFSGYVPIAWGGFESIEVIGNIYEHPHLLNS